MKRIFAFLVALGLLALTAGGFASQEAKDSFIGKWYQMDQLGEAWEIELLEGGKGAMRNAHQEIILTWEATFIGPDSPPVIELMADFGDGVMNGLDSMLFENGILESQDGRTFSRGEPDIIFLEPYEAARFAPKSAFDGVWELTGGLLTIADPPVSMDLDLTQLGLKPPVYLGIKNGMLYTSNQGDTVTQDMGVQSYYAGNAIYVGRAELGVTGILYYVSPGVLHFKNPGPTAEHGVDVTFTLYRTDLESMPASEEAWESFPFDTVFDPPTP